MPVLKIRQHFTLTHGEQVFEAGDVISCDDHLAAGIAHMTEPVADPAAEKRAKHVKPVKPAAA